MEAHCFPLLFPHLGGQDKLPYRLRTRVGLASRGVVYEVAKPNPD